MLLTSDYVLLYHMQNDNTVYFWDEGERGQIVDVDGEANFHFISMNHYTNYEYLPTKSV